MNNTNDKKGVNVAFTAINPYVQTNIVEATEHAIRGREYIEWGDGNRYPEYL